MDDVKNLIEPCDNVNIVCCLQQFKVCKNCTTGEKTVGLFGVWMEGECYPNPPNCVPVCGSVYGR